MHEKKSLKDGGRRSESATADCETAVITMQHSHEMKRRQTSHPMPPPRENSK